MWSRQRLGHRPLPSHRADWPGHGSAARNTALPDEAVSKTSISLAAILVFPRKSFRFINFSDQAAWILLAGIGLSFRATGTIVGTGLRDIHWSRTVLLGHRISRNWALTDDCAIV